MFPTTGSTLEMRNAMMRGYKATNPVPMMNGNSYQPYEDRNQNYGNVASPPVRDHPIIIIV